MDIVIQYRYESFGQDRISVMGDDVPPPPLRAMILILFSLENPNKKLAYVFSSHLLAISNRYLTVGQRR